MGTPQNSPPCMFGQVDWNTPGVDGKSWDCGVAVTRISPLGRTQTSPSSMPDLSVPLPPRYVDPSNVSPLELNLATNRSRIPALVLEKHPDVTGKFNDWVSPNKTIESSLARTIPEENSPLLPPRNVENLSASPVGMRAAHVNIYQAPMIRLKRG